MIIDFHKCYGGGGSGSGVTPQEVQAQIDSALTPYWDSAATESAITEAISGISLDGYYTSAQTDEKIASAVTPVANHLAEVEEITASAYTELHDDILALSARTPDMSAYTPTSGFSTINGSAITNGGNIVIQGGGGDMSNYWNSAETKSYVDSADTAILGEVGSLSAVVQEQQVVFSSGYNELHLQVLDLQDQIDTMDEVVSAALVDLEGKKVESQDVKHIVKLTQAQYDALVNKDPYTFYIIVSN